MNRPLLLGHRGARASRHIPENTLASFELCLQHGCDGFEFDVRQSLDGEAVICHDATTRGMKIAETAAKDLGLPTLEEVLQRFSARAFLDVELKVAGLEERTLAALRACPPKKGYVVSSFLPDVLVTLHALDSGLVIGLLCEQRKQLPADRSRAGTAVPPHETAVMWMIPRIDLVSGELIDNFHSAGKRVMAWTVNRSADIKRLAELGVDAIISDETEVAARVLNS